MSTTGLLGIDIDSLLNRSDRRPFSYGRKKALYEAPEFIQRLSGEETVLEGQSLCIDCKVRGFPAPTLRWFKDDEEIKGAGRIHVESNGTGGYSLFIDNVNKGDEAAYRCRAENVEGACSSIFFLSVRSKPKSKKKDQKSSPNKRTVSFPPMFSTIVEKVEEEEKQGEEQQKMPPSPMTEFYYALTLKGRQSWPTFLGDWAFANGGHSQKRRTDDEDMETHSAPTTPIVNGDHNGRSYLSPGEAREAARKSLRRSELAARAEAKKQRLDEDAAKKKAAADEEEKKKEEEEEKKREAEMRINMERQKREEAMRLRKKEREARLERERKAQEEERMAQLEKERLEAEAKQKANEKRKEEARLRAEKQKEEEKRKQEEQQKKEELKKEEENKKKENEKRQKEAEENRRKGEVERRQKEEEEKKRKEKDKKDKEEADRRKQEEEKKKAEEIRKRKETDELQRNQKEQKEKEHKRLAEEKRKREEEEKARQEADRKRREEKQRKEEEEKARLKDAAEKQKGDERKREEEKARRERERKEKEQAKTQEKPGSQKNVLQKFAKHLEPTPAVDTASTQKHEPRALHLFQDKIQKTNSAPEKPGDVRNIQKEKSPMRLGAEKFEALSTGGDVQKTEKDKSPLRNIQKEKSPMRLGAEKFEALSTGGDVKKTEKDKSPLRNIQKEKSPMRLGAEKFESLSTGGDVKNTQKDKSPLRNIQKEKSPMRLGAEKFESLSSDGNAKNIQKEKSPVGNIQKEKSPFRLGADKFESLSSDGNAKNIQKEKSPVGNIQKEKSPFRLGAEKFESLSTTDKTERVSPRRDKPTDIPNETQSTKDAEAPSTQTKREPRSSADLLARNEARLRPWQQKENTAQKQDNLKSNDQTSKEAASKNRLEELRRKDQERLEELKAQEQKRVEELKQREQKQVGNLRQRELDQRNRLRENEQKQREELRRKEQQQRDELRKREEEQREELRKKEEEGKKKLRASEQKGETKIEEKNKYDEDEKLKKQREGLRVSEVRQNEKLKVNEVRQKEDLHLKEVRHKEDLKGKEEKQKEELKNAEKKQLDELRAKQQQQKKELESKREEVERKRKEQKEREEQEELRRQYKKEQIRKEQLRRQYEEETKRKQQEEAIRLKAKQQEDDEEFQVKVYKRDYSFKDLRKSLESHLGGEVMDPEEHKYWDEILEKHDYSISDIRQVFDSASQEKSERPPRSRQRRNSIEETEMLAMRMKRSGSVSDIRDTWTNSLDRPKKKTSESQKRQKDEEFLKRAASITDLREQFLEVAKKQAESKKLPTLSGQHEAEITINRLKVDSPLSQFDRGSKSPISSRQSPSSSSSTSSQAQTDLNKLSSRTHTELSKLASSMASKRASFHEMLSQGSSSSSSTSDKTQKRMSYHGHDSYGSKDIPTYRRLAGWSDDVEKSREIQNPDKQKPYEAKRGQETTKYVTPNANDTKKGSLDTNSSSSQVRPFVYNSARTIARNSTGSINSHAEEFSSEDDVFSDEDNSNDDDNDEGVPPAKKPLFYFEQDNGDSSEGDISPTENLYAYHKSLTSGFARSRPPPKNNHTENEKNNNAPSDTSKEALDNRGNNSGQRENNNTPGTGSNGNTHSDINDNSKGLKITENVEKDKPISKPFLQLKSLAPSTNSLKDDEKVSEDKIIRDMSTNAEADLRVSQKSNASHQSKEVNLNIAQMNNVVSPSVSGKGEATPPIVVEMWEDSEPLSKVPKKTDQTLLSSQTSSLSTSKKNNALTAGDPERTEREPTPFFKDSATKNTHNQQSLKVHGQSSTSSSGGDANRVEREPTPTPYIDAISKQGKSGPRGPLLAALGKSSSQDSAKEFHREPTPFFEKDRGVSTSIPTGNNLGVPGQNVRPPRESTPFSKEEASTTSCPQVGNSTLTPPSTSLSVPTADGEREERESTPYYNESNPYEYIHHPDHHFKEKTTALVKQSSKEDDNPVSVSTSQASNVNQTKNQSSSQNTTTPANSSTPSRSNQPPRSLSLQMPNKTPVEPTHEEDTRSETSGSTRERRSRAAQRSRRTARETLPVRVITCQSPVRKPLPAMRLERGERVSIEREIPVTKSKTDSAAEASRRSRSLPPKIQVVDMSKVQTSTSTTGGRQSTNILTPYFGNVKIIQMTDVKSVEKITESKKESTETRKVVTESQTETKPTLKDSKGGRTKLEILFKIGDKGSNIKTKKISKEDAKETGQGIKQTTSQNHNPSKNTEGSQIKVDVKKTTATAPPAQSREANNPKSQKGSEKVAQIQMKATTTTTSSTMKVSETSKTTSTSSVKTETTKSRRTRLQKTTQQSTAPLALPETITVENSKGSKSSRLVPKNEQSTKQVTETKLLGSSKSELSTKEVKETKLIESSMSQQFTKQIKESQSATPSSEIKISNSVMLVEYQGPFGIAQSDMNQDDATSAKCANHTGTPNSTLFGDTQRISVGPLGATPPADTAWTKKEGKTSGFSGALSFLRPKRSGSSGKEDNPGKDKTKQGKSGIFGNKRRSEQNNQHNPGENGQNSESGSAMANIDWSRFSPFGRYTAEGICILILISMLCLYLNTPVEKCVCYVLAAFYTFCVLRILGLLD